MHAMAYLVKWTFNAANRVEDVWWKEMSIEAQILCEELLQTTHRGDSKVYFCHKRALYAIDLVKMTQQNLSTGRVRRIRRIEEMFNRPRRQLSPLREIPEACRAADYSFREADPFRDHLEDDRWRHSIEESSKKRQARS